MREIKQPTRQPKVLGGEIKPSLELDKILQREDTSRDKLVIDDVHGPSFLLGFCVGCITLTVLALAIAYIVEYFS